MNNIDLTEFITENPSVKTMFENWIKSKTKEPKFKHRDLIMSEDGFVYTVMGYGKVDRKYELEITLNGISEYIPKDYIEEHFVKIGEVTKDVRPYIDDDGNWMGN